MCYFDHQLWQCGYWRWGIFRAQCSNEYRAGETCGLKLIYNTYLDPGNCKHCEVIHKKERRMRKMLDDVQRWTLQGNRKATIEKMELDIGALQWQIRELLREHEARRVSVNGESDREQVGDDNSTSTYSGTTRVAQADARHDISELSHEIAKRLRVNVDVKELAARGELASLRGALPELIKAFSVMLGLESASQINQDIMYFVHKHHRNIALQLESMLACRDDEATTNHRDPDNMSLSDKMNLWDSKATTVQEPIPDSDTHFHGVKDDDDESINLPALSECSNVISKSRALAWLVASVGSTSLLQWGSNGMGDFAVNKIRQTILNSLTTGNISKREPPRQHQVSFRLKWSHIMNQSLQERTDQLDTIVMTVCSGKAQMTSMAHYVRQTWPWSGSRVFALLRGIAGLKRGPLDASGECSSPDKQGFSLWDNTKITGRYDGDNLILTATGPAYTLAECGEQLAWTTAALWPRARDFTAGFSPSVVRQDPQHVSGVLGSPTICFDVLVQQSPLAPEEAWWTNLVGRHPLVVHGFPVHRQPEGYSGLELSVTELSKMGYQPTILDSGKIRLISPERTLGLVKRAKTVFIWGDVRCLGHSCCIIDDSERSGDSEDTPSRYDLTVGTHIVIPFENICKGEDRDGVPARDSSKCSAAGPGMTDDGSPDTGRSSERDEPGPNSAKNDGTSRTGIGPEPQDDLSPAQRGDHMDLESSAPTSTNTSFESDLLSTSDPSESPSSLDRKLSSLPLLRNAIVHRLVSGYWHAHAADRAAAAGNQATGLASSSSAQASDNPPGPSRPGKKRKRQQASRGGDDDDDEGSERPRPTRARLTGPSKLFACPFWKAYPHRHHCCFTKILSRIRDVKQHLRRSHYSPFSCNRCSAVFPDEKALREHDSNPAGLFCTPSPQLDRISPHQHVQMTCKSDPKLSDEQQWFALWDTVFPGRRRPPSAYRDADISEELCSLREYCATYGEEILDHATQAVVATGQLPGLRMLSGEERQGIHRWVAREGFELAFRHWISARASSARLSSSGEMMTAENATPAGSSLRDSGIVAGTLPPASHSSLEAALECRHQGSVEEGIPSGPQDAVGEGENRVGPPPARGSPQGLMPHDDSGFLGLESISEPWHFDAAWPDVAEW